MNRWEGQWLAAVMLLVIALFVSGGLPLPPQWRRRLGAAAIALFAVAVAAVLVLVALWLINPHPR